MPKIKTKKRGRPKKTPREVPVEPRSRKKEPQKTEKKPIKKIKPAKYYEAVGRRKTATARVRLWTKDQKEFLVNKKPYDVYFSIPELQQIATAPLRKMNCFDKFGVWVLARGGGLHAQAEAIRHGIARALTLFNPEFRKRLRRSGYLTRDARMRERKKFGLKRARRAPQWQKR